MLKRGGRSYDKAGIEGTSPGELAVLCPACPLPSINLPPNWKSVGKDFEYIDTCYAPDPLLTRFVPGISITKHSVSMLASASSDGKSLATKKILSWVRGMPTLSHGVHITNTYLVSLTKLRFVQFIFLQILVLID